VFLAFIVTRIFYYLRVYRPIAIVVFTMRDVAGGILVFIVLLCVIVVGFINMLYALLQYDILRSVGEVLHTLAKAGVVNWNFFAILNSPTGYTDDGLKITGVAVLILYLLITILILTNLLIAMIGYSFSKVKDSALGLWNIDFGRMVLEFENGPLPPPFNIFSLLLLVCGKSKNHKTYTFSLSDKEKIEELTRSYRNRYIE